MRLDSPVARAFLDQRKDLRQAGGLALVQASGVLLGALLLRMVAVSNPALWIAGWCAHEAFQRIIVKERLDERIARVGDRVEQRLKNEMFLKAQRNRSADGESPPEVVKGDIDAVVAGWKNHVPFAVLNGFTLATSVVGAAIVGGPILVALLGGVSAAVAWQSRRQMQRVKPLDSALREAHVSFLQRVREFVHPDGRAYHHSMGISRRGVARGEAATARIRDASEAQRKPHVLAGRWANILQIAFYGGAMLVGAVTGNWIMAMSSAMVAMPAFVAATTLSTNFAKITPSLVAANEVDRELGKSSPINEHPNAVDLPRTLRRGLEFDHVTAGYVDGEPVLKNVSFVARPGTLTVIVGANGAGKTTIFKVAQHLLNVQSGFVKIDGLDVQYITNRSISATYGGVRQGEYLPTGTLRDTLRDAKSNATEAEMCWALMKVGGVKWLQPGALGLNTPISQVTNSPGERGQIANARALLKDSNIALFDESTAALDAAAREGALATMLELREHEKVVLATAHSLEIVKAADNVVVLSDGYVVEQGRPFELLAKPDSSLNRLFKREPFATVDRTAPASPTANREPFSGIMPENGSRFERSLTKSLR